MGPDYYPLLFWLKEQSDGTRQSLLEEVVKAVMQAKGTDERYERLTALAGLAAAWMDMLLPGEE